MDPPVFSVIVPVYQAEPWLRQCVDSVLDQTFQDLELILVDDGSTDGCPALCDEYAARDGRVRVLHQENAGPVPARRRGLRLARGAYVCFVDADDWVVPHWLETIKKHLDANGGLDVVLYDCVRDDGPAEQPLLAEEGFYDKARLTAEIYPYMLCDLRRRPFGIQFFPGYLPTKAYRRTLIDRHFLPDDRITIFEDTAMSYDCLWHARSLYVIREPLYVYRRVAQSSVHRYRADYIRQLKLVQDYMTATMGSQSPVLARQIDGFVLSRLIDAIVTECLRCGGVLPAARVIGRAMRQTGIMRAVSAKGLPSFMGPYVWLLKCGLYYPAVLITVMRTPPETRRQIRGG